MGHPSTVTSLITKGRGDMNQDQWVTKYKVSFSNDTRLWLYYKDKLQIEPKVRILSTCHRFERTRFFLFCRNFLQIMIVIVNESISSMNHFLLDMFVYTHQNGIITSACVQLFLVVRIKVPFFSIQSTISTSLIHLGACFPGYFRVNSEAQCGK